MKPKNKLQKEVARLSATLRPITTAQKEWAYNKCVEHTAYRTKSGTMTCSVCGHQWKSTDGSLCDTFLGCKCPHCGEELKVENTLTRKTQQIGYYSVISTCGGFQIIRVSQFRYVCRKGKPMKFYSHEVVQRWISADGKVTDIALLRGFSFCYCDLWALDSDMEIRPHNPLYDDVCLWGYVYPRMRTLPQLKRNGFNGDFYGISPVSLFKALLSNPKMETLIKEGKTQNICVFGSGYYSKPDTLILSARIDGEIIETVEVDLKTLRVNAYD